nr:rapid ALkalinization Factor [Tanacetum cinerariifolium]
MICTAFFLFLVVIGAKLVLSQEECTETHLLLGCMEDQCMDLCREKYGTSLSFKKQNKRRPHRKEPEHGSIPSFGGSSSTSWGECKNIFRPPAAACREELVLRDAPTVNNFHVTISSMIIVYVTGLSQANMSYLSLYNSTVADHLMLGNTLFHANGEVMI